RRHQREKDHTMTEFKPGNRVQWRDKDGILHRGTVDDVYDDCVYGTRDAGGRFVAGPWDLTKIDDEPKPLRFEDVRDGDTITVEGDEYKITGRAVTGYRLASVAQGLLVALYNAEGDEWLDQNALPVRLTAHTRAGPEWHRAKVSMGCYAEAGAPEEPEYWLLGRDGLFYSVSGGAEDYELTNVTIIVDEHGQMRA